MAKSELTDLEAAAIGFLASKGPTTPYAVRQCFLASPSARFSGSAGAIYPMLDRLEDRGMIASADAATGKRPARHCKATRTGKAALKRWLLGAFDAASTFAEDPLRTRMIYVQFLSPQERRAWLDNAEACLRAQLELIRSHQSNNQGSVWLDLAHDNATRLAKARLAWLAAARTKLERAGCL